MAVRKKLSKSDAGEQSFRHLVNISTKLNIKKIKQISSQVYAIWYLHDGGNYSCIRSEERFKYIASVENEGLRMGIGEARKTQFS